MEDVVAQHQTRAVVADELAADDECLRQAVGRRLLGVLEMHAVVRAVAEQATETGQIRWCGYNQYVPDSGKHKRRNGIIHHRLVVYRKHLLRHTFGYRIKPRAGTSG